MCGVEPLQYTRVYYYVSILCDQSPTLLHSLHAIYKYSLLVPPHFTFSFMTFEVSPFPEDDTCMSVQLLE